MNFSNKYVLVTSVTSYRMLHYLVLLRIHIHYCFFKTGVAPDERF